MPRDSDLHYFPNAFTSTHAPCYDTTFPCCRCQEEAMPIDINLSLSPFARALKNEPVGIIFTSSGTAGRSNPA